MKLKEFELKLSEFMSKFNKRRIRRICDLIKMDSYTVAEICTLTGISKETYYQWVKNKPDFSDLIKAAEAERNEKLVVEARRSLMKLIKGYDSKKITTIMEPGPDGKEHLKCRIITEKFIGPKLGAIIWTLANLDPKNWGKKHIIEVLEAGQEKARRLTPVEFLVLTAAATSGTDNFLNDNTSQNHEKE